MRGTHFKASKSWVDETSGLNCRWDDRILLCDGKPVCPYTDHNDCIVYATVFIKRVKYDDILARCDACYKEDIESFDEHTIMTYDEYLVTKVLES